MMDYIFIDFENVPVQGIPDHAGIQKVFLFAGEKQTKVSLDIAESMRKLGPKAQLVRMKGSGNNALDFHIAFYIGKYSESDPKATFKIVSKDKGFDPLVLHLETLGIKCARIETLATKNVSKKELKELIAGVSAHLLGISDKARPKKAAKLKHYIKSHEREEDAIVDRIFDGLVAEGIIEVDGVKVKYGNPSKNVAIPA